MALLGVGQTSNAQVKTPPLAQLTLDVESGAVLPSSLSGRINAAFDANLDGDWFAAPQSGLASTGADDTIRLIRVIKNRAANGLPSEFPAYRRAWRTLCRRVFALRVPPPKSLNADVGQHLDYPTSTQEFGMVQIVTFLLESTVDLWLTLDLGPTKMLDKAMAATTDAQALRTIAETANDRLKLGDVQGAYDKIVATCEDMSTAMNLGK